MLTKIREKTQGTFAAVILLMIGVPFALWGINNYLDNAREKPVASVGNKDFYQRDVIRAYEQYSRELLGLGIDEAVLKAQALDKLIKDEVLLQYVHARNLAVTDDDVRNFIKSLPYFQTDGKFDDDKYKSLLASQRMSSAEFVARIRKAMLMQQFQDGIVNSGFATAYDVERFFNIQNQQRDANYLTIPVQEVTAQPSDDEIAAYYQQHQNQYQTPEQVSIEYVQLSLPDVAAKVQITDDKLQAYYEEQKNQYTIPEHRKISHILFAVNDKTNDQAALEKAATAKQELARKDFAKLAAERSDDKATAQQGGDLGLFNAGVMEPVFDKAASELKLGEVSAPIRSSFGYHLIKVTELTPAETKPFAEVKDVVAKTYQKSQAENTFSELAEKLAELSYENPDNLQTVAETLSLPIKKTGLFTKDKGDDIAANDKIRGAAFSEEIQQGNNSEPLELDTDSLVVLRQLERKPAVIRDLADVKADIATVLSADKAKTLTAEKAGQIKTSLQAGQSMSTVAADNNLTVKQAKALMRKNTELPAPLVEAIFKAAKPVGEKPSIFVVALSSGEQVVVGLTKVTEGTMSEDDKKKMDLALKNLGQNFGQSEFNSVVNSLQANADISVDLKSKQAEE